MFTMSSVNPDCSVFAADCTQYSIYELNISMSSLWKGVRLGGQTLLNKNNRNHHRNPNGFH